MAFFKDLLNSGVDHAHSRSEKDKVVVINYISILLFFSISCLLVTRYLIFSMEPDSKVVLFGVVSLCPILLNRIGLINLAGLYISWIPSLGIVIIYIVLLHEWTEVYVTDYDSIFIYLLGVSCLPYLVTSSRHRIIFLLSLSLPMLLLFYCQEILDFFNVGPLSRGINPDMMEKNKMRSKIAFLIISGSCFTLKWLLEKGDRKNEDLINELDNKNKIIEERANKDLLDASNKINNINMALQNSQEKLIENEQRLSLALAATSDAIWEWDYITGRTFYSSRWYEMLGYQDKEFDTGFEIWQKLCHPDDFQPTVTKIDEVLKDPDSKGYNAEFRMLHKKGSWIWILGRGNVVKRDSELKPLLLSGTNTDISERKENELALRNSEEKYRTIFENIQDVFFQTDLSGTILEVSPSIFDYTGQRREDLIGTSVHELYADPDDRNILLQKLKETKELKEYEVKLKTNNEEIVYTSLNIRMFFDKQNNPHHMDGIIRDISERKRNEKAEDDLKEASQRLSLATKSAGIGIWEWHIETGKLIWDEQMYVLFEADSQYADIKDWRHHVHPDDFPDLSEKINETISTEKELITDFRIVFPSQKIRHIETIANVFKSPNKPLRMIGVCWDISDRKNTEEQLLQSEANLYATINNTTFFVWSLDRNFVIINLNKPFKNYLREHYKADISQGQSITEFADYKIEEFSPEWNKNYIRALAGESFEITEKKNGTPERHFKYSLNPIIENAIISGVTTFAEETTELKAKETKLVEADKKIGELKLMALRSAMNPHFIFNTLNSIQYFILKNDQLNAVNYLSTFSKLIRSILNNSVNNKISLHDEVEQIKNYVNLELLRFENKFDFILDIDEELDVDNIEISSMLIQPYIENAILHGLYNKTEKGELKISIKEIGESVLFEIEDNGIGREAASRFKAQSILGHKSLGSVLTEERLKLINLQSGATQEIEDLYIDGKPAGTRVKIWVN